MRRFVPILALAAFAAGGAEDTAEDIRALAQRQKTLYRDLAKIERAVKDMNEIGKMREEGIYVLNSEEKKLERKAKEDFQIFMERYRNDTLRQLAILDRLLGKEQYVHPLRKRFGKALDETVLVSWNERALDEIVEELIAGYGVQMWIKGDIDIRKTMSLEGEMSLMAILLQIENVFDARLVEDDGHLWFVSIETSKKPEPSDDE